MRISENMRYEAVSRSLSDLATRHAEAARQASSGQRVGAPSDDPVAAAELTRLASAKARTDHFQKAVSNTRGDAEIAESTLGEAGDLLTRARELAMQGANGSLGAAERATLADQVASLKQQMVSLSNTKGLNGYLFGGTATDTTPFATTGAFAGNDGAHLVEVSAGVSVRANPSGAQAFTAAGGTDTFATLDALEAGLRSNSGSAVSATLGALDASRGQIEVARSTAGLLMDRLDTTDSALQGAQTTLGSRASTVGAADPYATYSNLTQLGTALEQAIAVARTTLAPGGQRF
jgi:flagellar hook-associated protein 3 FlgL